MESPLVKNMRALADRRPDRANDLRRAANAFEDAIGGFYAEPQRMSVKQLIGIWSRARKLFCDVSGESLI